MTDWIQLDDITLNSGRESIFKIECDNITDTQMSAMCKLLTEILPPFGAVSGVPTGGLRVEEAMRPFVTKGPLLVVDDVWTTGGSINRHIASLPAHFGHVGMIAVLFSRGPTPMNVTVLCAFASGLWYV